MGISNTPLTWNLLNNHLSGPQVEKANLRVFGSPLGGRKSQEDFTIEAIQKLSKTIMNITLAIYRTITMKTIISYHINDLI
jgi:hypothetical protein